MERKERRERGGSLVSDSEEDEFDGFSTISCSDQTLGYEEEDQEKGCDTDEDTGVEPGEAKGLVRHNGRAAVDGVGKPEENEGVISLDRKVQGDGGKVVCSRHASSCMHLFIQDLHSLEACHYPPALLWKAWGW